MRLCLVLPLLLACSLTWAAPKRQPAQDIEQFLADAGVINQMELLRQNVSDTASGLVINAMGLLGVPYRAGGTSEATGFDCSGFVRTIFERSIGLVLPRRAKDQAEVTQNVEVKDLKPGDLVFYHTLRQAFSHVGIYIGNGQFIHSPRPGHQVRIEDMREAYWAKRFDGARRVRELTPSVANGLAELPRSLPSSPSAVVGSNMNSSNAGLNTSSINSAPTSTSASSIPMLGSAHASTLASPGSTPVSTPNGLLSNLLPLSLPNIGFAGPIGNMLPNLLGFKAASSNSANSAPANSAPANSAPANALSGAGSEPN